MANTNVTDFYIFRNKDTIFGMTSGDEGPKDWQNVAWGAQSAESKNISSATQMAPKDMVNLTNVDDGITGLTNGTIEHVNAVAPDVKFGENIANRYLHLLKSNPTTVVDFSAYYDLFKPTTSNMTWIQFEAVVAGLPVLPLKDNYDMTNFSVKATRDSQEYVVFGIQEKLTKYAVIKLTGSIRIRANTAFWQMISMFMVNSVPVKLNAYCLSYDSMAPKRGATGLIVRGIEFSDIDLMNVQADTSSFQEHDGTFTAEKAHTYLLSPLY